MQTIKQLIPVLVLLILPITTSAQSQGCFLYPESPFYCHELSREEALAECSLFAGCTLTTHFEEKTCKEIPRCNEIIKNEIFQIESSEDTNSLWPYWITIIAIFLFLLWLFYFLLSKRIWKSTYMTVPRENKKYSFSSIFSPFTSDPTIQKQITRHKQKKGHAIRNLTLSEMDAEPILEEKHPSLHQLKALVKHYDKKKNTLSQEGKKALQNLEELVELMTKKDLSAEQKLDVEDIFAKLRKITSQKK